jgi:hypothetical protein
LIDEILPFMSTLVADIHVYATWINETWIPGSAEFAQPEQI